MAALLMGKRKKPDPDDAGLKATSTGSIRIKPELAYKLRIVCEAEQKSAADFLDPLIRGPIEMHFKRVAQHLSGLAEKPPE